jgi:hypothetical protein
LNTLGPAAQIALKLARKIAAGTAPFASCCYLGRQRTGAPRLFFQAATEHDFPVLLGCTLIIGVATVAGNLAADFAYGILDPRIRYGNA